MWGGAHSSGEDDVVDGDENKFDEVTDHAHNEKASDASLEDLHVFGTVWLFALLVEVRTILDEFLDLVGDAGLILTTLSVFSHFNCFRDTTINYILLIIPAAQ